MFQFVRGGPEEVDRECVHAYRASMGRAVWLEPSGHDRRAWAQLRQMLPQLRRLIGGPMMEEVLARHRVVASLVLGRLDTVLTPEERRQRVALAASLTSNLSHNWFIERPFFDGLAALLHDLLSRARVRLVLPQLSGLDESTYALFHAMHRLHPGFQLDMVLGYTPGLGEEELDANGIAWGLSREKVSTLLTLLSALGPSEMREAAAGGSPAAGGVEVGDRVDVWDDDLDGRALEALAVTGRPLDELQGAWVSEAARRAFAAFDRSAALRFAMRALERCPRLSRQQAANLHAIASLSAHNRQFGSSNGDERFNAFVEHHLRRALELEEDPELRLNLCYRMAVTLGRRKKDGAVAMEFANQLVEGAQRAPLSDERRAYHETWGRSIRSYLHMGRGDFAAAFADGERAFEALAPFTADPVSASRDSGMSRMVLAENLEALSGIVQDEGLCESWLLKRFAFGERHPEHYGARFYAHRTAQVFGKRLELDLAIKVARQGLEDARGELSFSLTYSYLMDLGAFLYRKGDAAEALACFDEARGIARQRELKDARAASTSERFFALAAVRAGRPEEALASYQRLLEAPEGASLALRSELRQGMAIAAACLGDALRAEQWIDQAIDDASRLGTRGALAAVARSAGVVCQLLGRTREASEAYRRGWELAAAQGEGVVPGAGCGVALRVGLAEVEESEQEAVVDALRWMPEALQHDPDAWWYLSRLLRLVPRIAAGGRLADTVARGPLAKVSRAASQRKDCGEPLASLGS